MSKKFVSAIYCAIIFAFATNPFFAAEAPLPSAAKPAAHDAWINIGSIYSFPIGTPTNVASALLLPGNLIMSKPELIIFRSNEGVQVVSSRCPHCGATLNIDKKSGFVCTNDHSRFDPIGRPVRGPALESMEWYDIKFTEDSEVLVNKAVVVKHHTPYQIPAAGAAQIKTAINEQ